MTLPEIVVIRRLSHSFTFFQSAADFIDLCQRGLPRDMVLLRELLFVYLAHRYLLLLPASLPSLQIKSSSLLELEAADLSVVLPLGPNFNSCVLLIVVVGMHDAREHPGLSALLSRKQSECSEEIDRHDKNQKVADCEPCPRIWHKHGEANQMVHHKHHRILPCKFHSIPALRLVGRNTSENDQLDQTAKRD